MNKILLVEDDAGLAGMVSEYLGSDGFQVDCVHDGAAPAASEPSGYDLVILDVMLPNRSGFEVLKAIRQHSNIPVILLTARDNETDRMVGLELGGDDYIPKPFRPRELDSADSRGFTAYGTRPHNEAEAGGAANWRCVA